MLQNKITINMQQLQIKLQVHQQLYLTGSFESKTNIPMVSQIFLFLTTLLVQEDSGLLLEGLLVLQRSGAKGNNHSIKTFHAITRHSQNKTQDVLKTTPYKAGSRHICANGLQFHILLLLLPLWES